MDDHLYKILIIRDELKQNIANFFKDSYEILELNYSSDYLTEDEEALVKQAALVIFTVELDTEYHLPYFIQIRKFTNEYYIPIIVLVNQYRQEVWELFEYHGVDDIFSYIKLQSNTQERLLNFAYHRIKNVLYASMYKKEQQYDALTNSLNRKGFCAKSMEVLQEYSDQKFMIVFTDIERFKVINDLFGLKVGDNLLCKIADSSRKKLNKPYIFGRWKADQFVYLLPNTPNIIQTLANVGDLVFEESEFSYHVVIRFGIYKIEDNTVPIDFMVSRANIALRTIIGNHMKRYAIYNKKLRKQILEEQEIVNEMEYALEDGQFHTYLQPIYDAKTQKVVCAEALVRWIHPKKGMVSPSLFVPIFEKNGFISKMDAFMKETVCKYIKDAQVNHRTIVPISINISRRSFFDSDVCEHIVSLIDKYQINKEYLRAEITESAYTDNQSQLLKEVKRLKNEGITILMDDFGSGYSSLNTLKMIPVDYLKMDMKFLDDLSQTGKTGSIMASVVDMAKRLHIKIIAEGVETEEQFLFLKSIGCDLIQGFYYSKPICLDEFTKLLQREKNK